MRKTARGTAMALGVLLLAGCTVADEPTPSERGGVPGVASGLDAPWSVVFLSDGTPVVSERDSGRVQEIRPDGSIHTLGVVADVVHGGEGGLLGLAVDAQDRLYAYSTGPAGNRVQRFALSGEGDRSLARPETILDELPAAPHHNGGRIAFGPDGLLYVTVGDAGEREAAQDPDSPAGKILRVTADGEVPSDNPFPGSAVYSLGHRNPQGLAWSEDGTLFATEFGQDAWDELNIIVPGGNYGWPEVEGIAGAEEYRDPVQQWNPAEASPSGIALHEGALYIANLRGERLHAVSVEDPGRAASVVLDGVGRLRDAVVSPDGELWVITNNTDGRGEPRTGDDRLLRVDTDTHS